jgi:hypothetical protein
MAVALFFSRPRIAQGNRTVKNQVFRSAFNIHAKVAQALKLKFIFGLNIF